MLLEEAAANKKWTIPPHAVVELDFGPFSHFEITEIDDEAAIVCRSRLNHFCLAYIRPATHNCYCCFVPPSENAAEIHAAGRLLLSAIIRDFWVVEEREKVFSTKRTQQSHTIKGIDDRPRIVYIPRVRYVSKPHLENCAVELEHHERRKHFVSAHLRHAEQPSGYQLILAERYGFHVPVGYTFVKPHERGKKHREVIYRSRSALNSLYNIVADVTPGEARPLWFQFERDVHNLMSSLGFTVEHVSASRSGDRGVDVFALKGNDFEQVQWVIQCKCYAPSHKIDPSKIREMRGVLTDYPHGTRGMIVTTSSFTSGAIEEAKKASIRLVDGVEFLRLTNRGTSPN